MGLLSRSDEYTVQTLGFALVVLGFFLFMIGLIGGPDLHILTGQPLPWYWWVPTASFFSGIALVIVGIILLIVARGMKPEQWTDAAAEQVPESEQIENYAFREMFSLISRYLVLTIFRFARAMQATSMKLRISCRRSLICPKLYFS